MLTKTQLRHWQRLYLEATRPGSHLYHHLRLDLITGSVKMGNLTRNNPAIPENDIDDGVQSVFLTLLKMPYVHAPASVDARVAELGWIKEATLRFLSDRRIKMNRRVIEADLNHPKLVSGNKLVPCPETGGPIEFLTIFDAQEGLNVHSTQLIDNDPLHKSLYDYSLTSAVPSRCHPAQPNHTRGWCRRCCGYFTRRKHNKLIKAVPQYDPKLIPNIKVQNRDGGRQRLIAKTTPFDLAKAIAMRGYTTTSDSLKLTRRPPTLEEQYLQAVELKFLTQPDEYWNEFLGTWRETLPTEGNQMLHAATIRGLNEIRKKKGSDAYETAIRQYNQQVLRDSKLHQGGL